MKEDVLLPGLALGALCALLSYWLVSEMVPTAVQPWGFVFNRNNGAWLMVYGFAMPLLLMLGAVWPGVTPQAVRLTRWVILAHAGLSLALLVLPMLTGSGGVLAGTVVVDLVLMALLPKVRDEEQVRLLRKCMVWLMGSALAVLTLVPMANIALVAAQAGWMARGNPYCIQVPAGVSGGYKPVTNLLDLNGWKMRAPLFYGQTSYKAYNAFDAVLVIIKDGKPDYWNWSTARFGFQPISARTKEALHMSRPSCAPTPHFLRGLPAAPR